MSAGDPGRRSPKDVCDDHRYAVQYGYQAGQYYPSAAECVVRHRRSRTYWRCTYAVREDDSDYEWPTEWRQVRPTVVKVTRFVPVG